MKIVLHALILLGALGASAHPVVSDSESLYCKLTGDKRFPFLTGDRLHVTESGRVTEISRVSTEKFLFDRLVGWVDGLIGANDPLFAGETRPLCVGLYDDARGANAVAIGDGQIAFGAVLTARILNQFGESAPAAITYVTAHELAHILQQRLGLRFDYGLPGRRLELLSSKVKELHADCLAGYLLETHRQIPFTQQSQLEAFVRTLGDAHAIGDHGLPADRTAALREGARLAHLDRLVGMSAVTAASAAAKCGLKYRPQSF